MNVTTNETSLLEIKVNFIKTAINSNIPLTVTITGNDSTNSYGTLSHSVVAYGYDESGIYANFGWKDTLAINININN